MRSVDSSKHHDRTRRAKARSEAKAQGRYLPKPKKGKGPGEVPSEKASRIQGEAQTKKSTEGVDIES